MKTQHLFVTLLLAVATLGIVSCEDSLSDGKLTIDQLTGTWKQTNPLVYDSETVVPSGESWNFYEFDGNGECYYTVSGPAVDGVVIKGAYRIDDNQLDLILHWSSTVVDDTPLSLPDERYRFVSLKDGVLKWRAEDGSVRTLEKIDGYHLSPKER